jgi:hypothetical protein
MYNLHKLKKLVLCLSIPYSSFETWETHGLILYINNWQPGRKFCRGRQPNCVKIGLLSWPLFYSNFDGIRVTHFLHYRISLFSRHRPLGHTQYAKNSFSSPCVSQVSTSRVRYIRAWPPTNQSQDVKVCRPIKLRLTRPIR